MTTLVNYPRKSFIKLTADVKSSYQDGKNNFSLITLSTSRKCFLDQMALMHIYVRRAKFHSQISFVKKIHRICTLRIGILFDSNVLRIWKCKMCQLDNFKTSVVTMLNRHYSCNHSQGTGKPKWTNQKWIKHTKRPLCGRKGLWANIKLGFDFTSDCLKKMTGDYLASLKAKKRIKRNSKPEHYLWH